MENSFHRQIVLMATAEKIASLVAYFLLLQPEGVAF